MVRDDYENNGNIINSRLIELFNEGRDIQSILGETVKLLREYLDCEAVGIRVMDELGNIPYQAHTGFADHFIAKESPLCIRRDRCACIDISKGQYDPTSPHFTPYGSFHTNNLQSLGFIRDGMADGSYRGECVLWGWESFTLVPVKFGLRYYGLIHVVDNEKDKLTLGRIRFVENIAGQLGLYMQIVAAGEDKEKELSFLVKRIMHDMKQPLSSILMFAELINEEYSQDMDPELAGLLKRIVSNAGYMDKLVSSLGAFSDTLGRPDVQKDDIDLGVFVNELINDMSMQGYPGLKITVDDNLPIIRYPSLYLRRLLSNLISNAIKYSSDNSAPRVEIGCEEKNTYYQIFVSDNGMGIKDADVEQVFLPFYRTSSAKGIPGSGLGLSICKKIVESCGGNIWVYSQEGEGSTFYFTVPK